MYYARLQLLSLPLQTITLFLARGLPAGLRAIMIFSLAAHTDKSEFAHIVTAIVVVETLRIIFDCGQDTISIRLLSRKGNVWRRTISACIRIKVCTWGGGFLINLLLVAIYLLPGHLATAVAIASLGVSQIFWNLPINMLQARGWLQFQFKNIWFVSIILMIGVVLVSRLLPIYSAIEAYAVLEFGGLVLLAGGAYRAGTFREDMAQCSYRFRRLQTLIYLQRGWHVCVGQLAALAYGKFDLFLVTRFSAISTVANYLFAQRIFELAGFFTGGASSVMYAHLARNSGGVPTVSWAESARRWGRIFLALVAGVAVAFWILCPPLIRYEMRAMVDSIPYLRLFGVIAILSVVGQYMTALLNSIGGFRTLARISVLNLIIILPIGGISFYFYRVPGLLLSIAAVYLSSAVLQLIALRERVGRSYAWARSSV